MAKNAVLNFKTLKKSTLTIRLDDEENTAILVKMPTKRVLEDVMAMQEEFNNTGDDVDAGMVDQLYNACGEIMSCNLNGITITGETLKSKMDIEDLTVFFNAYIDFVSDVVSAKN